MSEYRVLSEIPESGLRGVGLMGNLVCFLAIGGCCGGKCRCELNIPGVTGGDGNGEGEGEEDALLLFTSESSESMLKREVRGDSMVGDVEVVFRGRRRELDYPNVKGEIHSKP
jgi:hypothetical protein